MQTKASSRSGFRALRNLGSPQMRLPALWYYEALSKRQETHSFNRLVKLRKPKNRAISRGKDMEVSSPGLTLGWRISKGMVNTKRQTLVLSTKVKLRTLFSNIRMKIWWLNLAEVESMEAFQSREYLDRHKTPQWMNSRWKSSRNLYWTIRLRMN